LIFENRANTISNHFKTWIKHDADRFYGNITENRFKIWRFTIGAQGMHPVIFGEVIQKEYYSHSPKSKTKSFGYLLFNYQHDNLGHSHLFYSGL